MILPSPQPLQVPPKISEEREKVKKFGTNIPNITSLKDIGKVKPKEDVSDKKEAEAEAFRLNSAVSINAEEFDRHKKELIRILDENKNLTLSSVLKDSRSDFDFNKWIIRVSSNVHEQYLFQNREMILNHIRKLTKVNDLYMEIQVDMSLQPQIALPMNAVEKFQLLAEKNPDLLLLQEIFKTRIID